MLHHILNALRNKNLFLRERKSIQLKALSLLLYHLGLSLRHTSAITRFIDSVSHESIRKWYARCRGIFSSQKKERLYIAIDETKIKVRGREMFLWAAIDISSWEVISVWVSQGRSGFEAYNFIKDVLRKCDGRPTIYVDRGPWYRWALTRLGVPYRYSKFGPRNPVEQWFGIFKHRIARFYRRWPHNASLKAVNDWVKAFTSLYNLLKVGGG